MGAPGQTAPGALHELTGAARRLAAARAAWSGGLDAGPVPASRPPQDEPVSLFGGWLPGSTSVSRDSSSRPDIGRRPGWTGARLSPHLRASLQMIIAGAGAIVLGDILSGYRFYWSALAAFFILLGTNHTGEQVRKGVYRVAGTIAGVALGIPVVHLAGPHAAPVIAVVLASVFLGLYLIRISYMLMITAITVAIAELYVEFGEFSDSLLMLRLEETAIGAAVTMITVLIVLPLHPARVIRAATDDYVAALTEVADELTRRHRPGEQVVPALGLHLDVAYQSLLAVASPRYAPYGPLVGIHPPTRLLDAAGTGHHRARALLAGTDDRTTEADALRAVADLAGLAGATRSAAVRHSRAGKAA